ncbi:MAG: hypothetical protein JNM71_09095 [Flavobacterium lindanitolerans]|uniref:hypothetical protein n=1 Tax=Flavobacterium lindanitolerans TaxID=428988 RepID=UPI001A4FE855|nr:hypothetical protein [Flavobacterium lindanitolerans]MBL7868165.1 hypothetical protein [Flavobacterium lindanitolerans]
MLTLPVAACPQNGATAELTPTRVYVCVPAVGNTSRIIASPVASNMTWSAVLSNV